MSDLRDKIIGEIATVDFNRIAPSDVVDEIIALVIKEAVEAINEMPYITSSACSGKFIKLDKAEKAIKQKLGCEDE